MSPRTTKVLHESCDFSGLLHVGRIAHQFCGFLCKPRTALIADSGLGDGLSGSLGFGDTPRSCDLRERVAAFLTEPK
jgi:hypothetical protein